MKYSVHRWCRADECKHYGCCNWFDRDSLSWRYTCPHCGIRARVTVEIIDGYRRVLQRNR